MEEDHDANGKIHLLLERQYVYTWRQKEEEEEELYCPLSIPLIPIPHESDQNRLWFSCGRLLNVIYLHSVMLIILPGL